MAQRPRQPRLGRPRLQQRVGPADRVHLGEPPLGDAGAILLPACELPRPGLLRGHRLHRLERDGCEGSRRGFRTQHLQREVEPRAGRRQAQRQLHRRGRSQRRLGLQEVVLGFLGREQSLGGGEAPGVHGGLADHRDALPVRARDWVVQDAARLVRPRSPRHGAPPRPGALGAGASTFLGPRRPPLHRLRGRGRHHLGGHPGQGRRELVWRGAVWLLRPRHQEGRDRHQLDRLQGRHHSERHGPAPVILLRLKA
mmetsp:Transcript_126991/g.355668  ORF Transcript_126991/g.355668 Transcript_126991/m.355668 type:complete len:254 (+) Transcript_126991:787-1548(+)